MNYFNQESERLIFRKLTKLDFDLWLPFFSNNPSLPYLGIDLTKEPEALAMGWIERQLERYEFEGLGHLAAIEKSTGKFVGMGGLLPRNMYNEPQFEIAYSVLQAYWRNGYGTEIARMFHDYGLKNKVSKDFISIIEVNNLGSIKVALNNGMELWKQDFYSGMNVNIYKSKKA